ncbi:MAG TPA: choice-of-anchor J domain-containing protein [Clostridia bacterium]|nr:choice-of-anchor J domain-containing protein [Clostridia bacterium]
MKVYRNPIRIGRNGIEDEIENSILLDEDFNDGFPSDWIIINDGSSPDTWKLVNDRYGQSLDGTPFMIVDSDAGGQYTSYVEFMRTPIISDIPELSSEQSLILSFTHYYHDYTATRDYGEVRVNNGSSWQTIETYDSDQGSWANPVEETIDITPYINDDLQICFFYNDDGSWAWYWAIDNVKIEIVN